MAFLDHFLYFKTICQNAPLQSCQKVAKKWILSNESGQTNFKKVPKWLDSMEPSVEGKMEKMAKFWSFFWEKRPVY